MLNFGLAVQIDWLARGVEPDVDIRRLLRLGFPPRRQIVIGRNPSLASPPLTSDDRQNDERRMRRVVIDRIVGGNSAPIQAERLAGVRMSSKDQRSRMSDYRQNRTTARLCAGTPSFIDAAARSTRADPRRASRPCIARNQTRPYADPSFMQWADSTSSAPPSNHPATVRPPGRLHACSPPRLRRTTTYRGRLPRPRPQETPIPAHHWRLSAAPAPRPTTPCVGLDALLYSGITFLFKPTPDDPSREVTE